MTIVKSEGTTPSEKLLAKQCDQTFLGFWSYANTYRDQGQGKEVCDLLVVCGNHIILFSDKSCAFPDTGNLQTDWSRWFRRSILKSVDQVLGAERWLKDHPHRVFLDRKCTQPLPISLANVGTGQFHRIVVALGAKDRCKRYRGGSGSLALAPSINDSQAHPFFIGPIGSDPGQFHVLDEYTLPLLLQHLDTVSDFVAYLEFKESLFRSSNIGTIFGEENLLALFLSEYVRTGDWREQLNKAKDGATLSIWDGTWEMFTKTGVYKQVADIARASRGWDRIIQQFATHAFEGTLLPGSPDSVATNEEMLRTMAQEPRIARLFLTAQLHDRWSHHEAGRVDYRLVASPTHADTLYAFVFVPNAFGTTAEYRKIRQEYLRDYCLLVANKRRSFRHVFGIATEAGDEPYRTFDIVTFEAKEWTPEVESLVREIQADLEVTGEGAIHTLTDHSRTTLTEARADKPAAQEPLPRIGKVGRNEPCPCGSGKKFKNCCLPRTR